MPEAIHGLLADCGLKVSLMARSLADPPALSEPEFGYQIRTVGSFCFIAYP